MQGHPARIAVLTRRVRVQRRSFTLFLIPLIPTKDLGELVQCDTCQKSFTVAVLKAPTTAALQDQLLWAIREAVCATGGVIDESGRALVQHIAAGLMMTPAHTRGLIDQVVERSAT